MPILRIKLPDNKGEITHVLAGARITIGRRPENTIQVIDRTVSGHHAELISVDGHYRLHDLGSTNLTCVNGQPITDFHLHDGCKVSFGTVECEFSPETPVNAVDQSEVVPTKAEMEFLRRENLDLQAKIVAMQKQIDILSSARLMTKETQNLGVMPEVHKRVTQERDELRTKTANLERDLENLKSDLASLAKERDALRLAWETLKREGVDAAAARGETVRVELNGSGKYVTPPNPTAEAEPSFETTRSAPDHRAMATILMTAPGSIKGIRAALETLANNSTDSAAATELSSHAEMLLQALSPLARHPAHRLAAAVAAMIRDARTRTGHIEPGVVTSLNQAVDVISGLLDPRAFKKASEAASPKTLIVDDDESFVDMLSSSLSASDFQPARCTNAEQALTLLGREQFDLVLLDIALQGSSGFDVCARIRETQANKQTPVIFVTGADSVENRALSSVTGGDDFIAKPLNMYELAVKASTWACRHQLSLKN